MKVTINGKDNEIQADLSIYELLEQKGINPASVVIEHNYEIPDKKKLKEIVLNDGDNLEIIKFMGGG